MLLATLARLDDRDHARLGAVPIILSLADLYSLLLH